MELETLGFHETPTISLRCRGRKSLRTAGLDIYKILGSIRCKSRQRWFRQWRNMRTKRILI